MGDFQHIAGCILCPRQTRLRREVSLICWDRGLNPDQELTHHKNDQLKDVLLLSGCHGCNQKNKGRQIPAKRVPPNTAICSAIA